MSRVRCSLVVHFQQTIRKANPDKYRPLLDLSSARRINHRDLLFFEEIVVTNRVHLWVATILQTKQKPFILAILRCCCRHVCGLDLCSRDHKRKSTLRSASVCFPA